MTFSTNDDYFLSNYGLSTDEIKASQHDGNADSDDDPVNHPSHYTDGNIEVIDFITDKKLGFSLGNAVKYIARAGKKDEAGMTPLEKEIQDLEKARYYLNHRIKELKDEA